jgi:hypothetical protein
MRWTTFEARQPRLAELGRRRLLAPGVVLVATIRADGTPRVSAVEPWLMDGDLWLAMLWNSRKAHDLQRDPRLLVHSIVTSRDGGEGGEFKARGRAVAEEQPAVQRQYAGQVARELGWTPTPGRFHLFRLDIDTVSFLVYDDPSGDQHGATWPPGKEFVRRSTSATSLGEAEPVTDILIEE